MDGSLTLDAETQFLSTPSGWRATVPSKRLERHYRHFYPRPPGGGRPSPCASLSVPAEISIHALRVEGDSKNGQSFRLFLRKREKNLPR